MKTGRVVRFDEVRGYGFLAPDDGGEDVFVHANDLADGKQAITPGTAVEFNVMDGERGLKGYDVRVVRINGRNGSTAPNTVTPATGSTDDDGTCDVLTESTLRTELTEAFLAAAPEMTAMQIVELRKAVIGIANGHGWTDA